MAARIAACLCVSAVIASVLPVETSDDFRSLSFIQNPNLKSKERILDANNFSYDHRVWVFPFLRITQIGNITGWVFRVDPPPPQRWTWNTSTVPFFELWQEDPYTNQEDYNCVSCSTSIRTIEQDVDNPNVYRQLLTSPLPVATAQNYILGIRLPEQGVNNLNLLFLMTNDIQEKRSYYTEFNTTFFTINNRTFKDNEHIPLVRPLYDETTIQVPTPPSAEQSPHRSSSLSSSTTTGTMDRTTPSAMSSSQMTRSTPSNQPPPTHTGDPPTNPSSEVPIALIVGTAVTGVVLVTLVLLGLVLLLKYRQMLKSGKKTTHMENPTYQVPENGTHTEKSTSSNGSHHLYATPTAPTFLSASLPQLPSHQIAPRIPPPPLDLSHYEIDDTHRQSHVYDQPGLKAATMPPPLPYEVPHTPNREVSTKIHVYSELECGEFPSLHKSTTIQEDKKSLISGSQTSSIFDNSIYKDPNNLVPSVDGSLGGGEDLYWKPASSSQLLYDQLSRRKFQEIQRTNIKLTKHLGAGQFGTVNKGVWLSPEGEVVVAVKQLQLSATEQDRVRFLQEAAIMGQFYHPNVVKLHGVVTKDDPIMIVLEYMTNGDLRNSLLDLCPKPHEPIPDTLPLLLLRFCQEVATGMAYLSKKAFVHRDIAARNILLDSNSTCKIGDFGMSRDLEDSNYYITNGGIIPVKWTAPEALNYKKYSTASDVWSFGCLMYEIWSLGHKPFEQYSNMDCIKLVSQGFRLPPPAGCCRALYKLMILCWHVVPSQRPMCSEMQHVLTHLNTQLLEKVDPELGKLGGPPEAGENVYPDLQDYYLQDKTEYSSDSR